MTSKIKVDNIENQCGGAVVTKCGATTTISGSVVKADDIQAADGGNIINQCGTTITLGASGDTISLAAGASQTGFGRTGTVDWDTTAKTASFTAVSGNGYFVNTTSGAITLTLPASPSAGDIVAFKDYAYTFATNNLTVDGNGSPIGGTDGTILPTYSTNGTSKTFIYVDGTKGWLVTNESTDTSQEQNNTFICATGGTITTSGDYKIHTFTGPGTFCVSAASGPVAVADYMVVAGGGGGGRAVGGGGAGGGYRESHCATTSGCYTASPLATATSLPISVSAYPIAVGGGGPKSSPCTDASQGSNSSFSSIISTGGGFGGSQGCGTTSSGGSGGSGGGASGGPGPLSGSAGNTPPVSPSQGNPGGNRLNYSGGAGGGGAGGAAAPGVESPNAGGDGGGGTGGSSTTSSINGTPTARAGGGGGGGTDAYGGPGPGGASGGGGASAGGTANTSPASNATANTGGGGGGSGENQTCGSNGGSGIVIIRYKYQ